MLRIRHVLSATIGNHCNPGLTNIHVITITDDTPIQNMMEEHSTNELSNQQSQTATMRIASMLSLPDQAATEIYIYIYIYIHIHMYMLTPPLFSDAPTRGGGGDLFSVGVQGL